MPKTPTIGLLDLAKELAARLDVSQGEAREAVRGLFRTIRTKAQQGEAVKIRDFGTFQYRARAARTGRNPRTGEPVAVAPSRGLAFRASRASKDSAEEIQTSTRAKKSATAK